MKSDTKARCNRGDSNRVLTLLSMELLEKETKVSIYKMKQGMSERDAFNQTPEKTLIVPSDHLLFKVDFTIERAFPAVFHNLPIDTDSHKHLIHETYCGYAVAKTATEAKSIIRQTKGCLFDIFFHHTPYQNTQGEDSNQVIHVRKPNNHIDPLEFFMFLHSLPHYHIMSVATLKMGAPRIAEIFPQLTELCKFFAARKRNKKKKKRKA